MEHMLVCILLIQWITLVNLAFSTAVTEIYLGVGWCSFHTYNVNEAQYYEIVWEGSDLPFSCRIGFEGRSAHDVYDQYQVCVEASEYHVSDCTFHMKYYDPGRHQKQLVKSYSCGFGPGKYCAVENENFVIEFSNFRTSTSVVRLMVTAKKTYDYEPPLLAAVVGGVLGGAVIITVVAVVVIMFRIRKRRWRKPPPVHVPLPPPDPDRETCV